MRPPKIWNTCGQHVVKALVEAKTGEKKPYHYYQSGWFSRKTNFMTPLGMVKQLKKHGLDYQVLKVKKMTREEKIAFLKKQLKK